MNRDFKKLAELRFSRAKSTFEEGASLLSNGFLPGATNRFYYAAFYAAKALLACKELDPVKHKGTISLFHEHFVKTKFIDPDIAKSLSHSFEQRQSSDYGDFYSLSENAVQKLKTQVAEFLDECGKVLATLLKNGTSAREPEERYSAKRPKRKKRVIQR